MSDADAHTLDLHGLTWVEAEAAFIEFYDSVMCRVGEKPSSRLDVIHGYGSTGAGGVLRTRLRGFLERHVSCLQFQPGEDLDGNRGHTIVVPMKPLPTMSDQLEKEILAYCERPRTQGKITGKFRRHGETEVLRAIKILETGKRLNAMHRGRLRLYQAASV